MSYSWKTIQGKGVYDPVGCWANSFQMVAIGIRQKHMCSSGMSKAYEVEETEKSEEDEEEDEE